jgi:hypothetical protein
MARLVVRFLAHYDGELNDLLVAYGEIEEEEEDEESSSSSQSTTSSGSTMSSTSSGSSTSSSSSAADVPDTSVYDTNTDTTLKSSFLLLGEESPILGSVRVMSEIQPLNVDELILRFTTPVTSIRTVILYDQDGKRLGVAHLDPSDSTGKTYVLPLNSDELTLERSESYSFYARAVLKSQNQGGTSGEIVEVDRMGLQGHGEWNNKNQSSYSDASDNFPTFQTSRSIITSVTNPDASKSILVAGLELRLGSFRIRGRTATGDGQAELEVTHLTFNLSQTGGVSVSNVELGSNETNELMDCTVAANLITCNNIPPSLGSMEDIPRTITLYGDITIPAGAQNANLQIILNDPGDTVNPGAVKWTDGFTVFQWLPDGWPVATGTLFEY